MANAVHALQARVGELAAGRACFLIDTQEAWYSAMTAARQLLGLTQGAAEDRIGLAERHLNKIEPARNGEKPYMRLPFRQNFTAFIMAKAYGLRLMLVPEEWAEALLEAAPPAPVKMTTHQRRKLGLLGEQMELPLPCPVRRVSVAVVESDRKAKAAKAKLKRAA